MSSDGYKETKIGKIPEEWSINKLSEITLFIRDGTHGTHKNVNNGIPLLSAKDVNNGKITFDNDPRLISNDDFQSIHKKYSIMIGDLVLTIVGTIGRVAVVEDYTVPYTFQRSVAIIRMSNKDMVRFVFFLLQSHILYKQLLIKVNASAQGGVYLGELNKLLIPLPSLPEQCKIAEILSTVDEAIEKTDRTIEETRQLKKGLMQKLFLNRAYMVTSKAKKEKTALVPVCFADLGDIVTGTTPSTKVGEYYNKKEYMFIGPADLGKNKLITKSTNYISTKGYNVSRQIPKDSIMVVCIGATIGKVGISSDYCATNQQINTIIPSNKYSADYIYYLVSGLAQYLLSFAGDTATPILNKGDFSKVITFIHDDVGKRNEIASILSQVDAIIEKEQTTKDQLEQLKKGLMQVLLTGKVRVKV